MTFVAAKRSGERIYIGSDTMISDSTKPQHDVIPGRLKVIILDAQTTVAYAGLVDQSIDTIRRAKQHLSDGGGLLDVEKILISATLEFGGKLEFLIASHRDGCTLKRIWDGHISSSLEQTCIGQRDLLPVLIKKETEILPIIVPDDFEEGSRFMSAFQSLFDGPRVSDNVGGFGIMALCHPSGHMYLMSGGATAWASGQQVSVEQQLADKQSGMTQWRYGIFPPKLRGAGVVGAIVQDAGIGYIYTPLKEDNPIEWRYSERLGQDQDLLIQAAFQEQIDKAADRIGGGIDVPSSPLQLLGRAPTEIELGEVATYAALVALPAQITLGAEAVEIRYETGSIRGTASLTFSSLGQDPVRVLMMVIDRLAVYLTQRA
jgi:hypothetical protein